jgi:hypothetical protein
MSVIGTKADFSQQDPRWAGHLLGFANWQTMGAYGCYVDAMANVAQANGKDIDPGQLNELLKQHNLFAVDAVGEKSDISRHDALSIIYPDIKMVETKNWGTSLADIAYFDVRNSTQDEIILMLDYHPDRSGIQMHFCRVVGTNDAKTDVEIVDSYTGKRIWVSSLGAPAGKLIYFAVKFRGPGTTGAAAQVPAPTPTPVSQTVTLPKSVAAWALYKEGSALRKGTSDQIATLSPASIGRDLVYDIVRWVGNYAVVIDTSMYGRGVIWVKDTDAIIK